MSIWADFNTFIEGLSDGDVVHVVRIRDARRNALHTRCVARHEDGQTVLRAVALVGKWPDTALPRRTELGTITITSSYVTPGAAGSPAEEVLNGMPVTVTHPSRLVELTDPALAAQLAKLPAIDLTVEPMDDEQRVKAWDRWLSTHLASAVMNGSSVEDLLAYAAAVTAARPNPFPEGDPTLQRPSHPELTIS